MDKTELLGCLEQADSQEAGALLRSALRANLREALVEIMQEEVEALCGPRRARGERDRLLARGKLPSEGEVRRAD